MATTTVRLDDDDEQLLDQLSVVYGGRSNTIRQAIRHLSAEVARQESLAEFLVEWEQEAGSVDEGDVAAMGERFGL